LKRAEYQEAAAAKSPLNSFSRVEQAGCIDLEPHRSFTVPALTRLQ
jgi:hypothetical protein